MLFILDLWLYIWFQFYDSPIKRINEIQKKHRERKFQFYDSPIKSSKLDRSSIEANLFQFYDSPIKSGLAAAKKRGKQVSIL